MDSEPFGGGSGARLAATAVTEAAKRLSEILSRFETCAPSDQALIAVECVEELERLFSILAPLTRRLPSHVTIGDPDPRTRPARKLREAVRDMRRRIKTSMFPDAKGSRGHQPLDSGSGRARVMACVAAKLLQRGQMKRGDAFDEVCVVLKQNGYAPSDWTGAELQGWFDNELPKPRHSDLRELFKSYEALIQYLQPDPMITGTIARNLILSKI